MSFSASNGSATSRSRDTSSATEIRVVCKRAHVCSQDSNPTNQQHERSEFDSSEIDCKTSNV
jgi:hypothetical protein